MAHNLKSFYHKIKDGAPHHDSPTAGRQNGWPERASDSAGDVAQQAIDVFLLSSQSNGEIGGIGHWQTANGYTARTFSSCTLHQ